MSRRFPLYLTTHNEKGAVRTQGGYEELEVHIRTWGTGVRVRLWVDESRPDGVGVAVVTTGGTWEPGQRRWVSLPGRRICAAPDCEKTFEKSGRKLYCSNRCSQRVRTRKYRIKRRAARGFLKK